LAFLTPLFSLLFLFPFLSLICALLFFFFFGATDEDNPYENFDRVEAVFPGNKDTHHTQIHKQIEK
jgi:hypothetical protein